MLNIKKNLTTTALTIISLFLIGCELEPQPVEYDFELYGESLSLDENGFYHFDLSDGIVYNGITSRTKLVANTNNPNIQKVGFVASHYWYVGDTLGYVVSRGLTDDLVYVSYDTSYVTWFNGFEVPVVNGASYSDMHGEVNTMIAPVQTMKGDTLTIEYSYYDEWKLEETIGEFGIVLD